MFSITLATEADIDSLRAAAAESWRAIYADIYPPDYIDHFLANAYNEAALRHAVANARTLFLVAKEGEYVVGFSQTGERSGEDDREAELFRIYVRPAYWGQGLGRALLTRTEAWLTSRGVTGYACFVHAQNEIGQAFYQKMGFIHRPAYDHEDEWYLWKQLEPV